MNILSAACFLLLSANASIVSGSGIRGSGLEMEQEKKESSRNLSDLDPYDESEDYIDNVPDDLASWDNEIDVEDEDEAEAEDFDDIEEPDGNGSRARGYSYQGGKGYQHSGSSYPKGNSYQHSGSSYHGEYSNSYGGQGSSYSGGYSNSYGGQGSSYSGGYSNSYGGRGSSYSGGHATSSYHKHWNKGCRTHHGGKGSSNYDFDLYNYVDKCFCKSKCDSLGQACYGYEFSNSGGRCEVWKVLIKEVAYEYGRDCYKKF